MFIPGIGAFVPVPAPDGQAMWSPQVQVTSTLFPARIEVNVILSPGESPNAPLITEILADIDDHLSAALRFLHRSLLSNPSTFGLTDNEATRYHRFDPTSFPVDHPQLTFYADSEWLIRFAEGTFPICDPYGVGVTFADTTPVRVEDFSDCD
ncbi:hypothetical protein ABZ319_24530 [Nocardia sp. NPDC005978]|uniref:hypothetical protein n=1 Tax=Nocardia sp. NPDC005978 TaxID=3156725 RepID=UPI0033A57D4C